MPQSDTRERILNAAERLFALQGLDATSLRSITREADVNLAAVNYHFGSKEGLIQAAFTRRVGPINRNRLQLLDEYEASLGEGDQPDLREVVRRFIRPIFETPVGVAPTDMLFLRLVGRLYAEPAEHMRKIFMQEFSEVARRYQIAIERALPGTSETDILWSINFALGMISHTLLGTETLREFTHGVCDPRDHKALIERLTRFICSGMCSFADPAMRSACCNKLAAGTA